MLCNNCSIELRMDKFENNVFYFKCIKCGNKLQKTSQELEKDYSKVKKESE